MIALEALEHHLGVSHDVASVPCVGVALVVARSGHFDSADFHGADDPDVGIILDLDLRKASLLYAVEDASRELTRVPTVERDVEDDVVDLHHHLTLVARMRINSNQVAAARDEVFGSEGQLGSRVCISQMLSHCLKRSHVRSASLGMGCIVSIQKVESTRYPRKLV